MVRVLTRADVRQAVTMAEAIEAVQAAYVQLSLGEARVPVRLPVEVPEHEGVILYMPAYLPRSEGLGAKIVTVFPHNPRAGLPTIHALVVVNDARTGAPLAVMEAGYLTALRTGAAAGVATRLLARPDARTAAIIGAGVQGRTQLEAIAAVRNLECAWVFDTDRAAAERFAVEMAARGGRIPRDVRVAHTAAGAVRDADVISTATTSRQPVFADADLKPGAHVNGIGSFTPEMQEIPPETVRRARIVVDNVAACLAEAGDLIIPLRQGLIGREQMSTEIGHVAAGTHPGRSSPDEVTFFKSVGNAVQDVAVAQLVLARASTMGLGVEVEL